MSTPLKNKLSDLAVLGGSPAFAEKVHVGRPNIGNRERLMKRIEQMLDARWFSNNGPMVRELEQKMAEFVGVKHCIAMCNATIALEITTRALELSGEVIVPSFTFIATAHSLQWQKITPVFCDIDPATHTLDPKQVERMITPRTTGIMGVHLWGRPCSVEALQEIATRRNLRLVFDASHAFGCSHGGRMIGSFGDAEVFSFHATKFLNTFEGGAVMTNNDALAAKIRLMKNFGFADFDKVIYIGTNGKMNEMSAAMGLTSLESIDEFVAANRCNYRTYGEQLRGVPGVTLLSHDDKERRNHQYIVLEIDERSALISRDEILRVLHAENIVARRYFYPGCHRMEPYRSYFPHAGLLLPETEKLAERVLVLPTGTSINAKDIQRICQVIRISVEEAGELRRRMENPSSTAVALRATTVPAPETPAVRAA